jgi:hypothetical protein
MINIEIDIESFGIQQTTSITSDFNNYTFRITELFTEMS